MEDDKKREQNYSNCVGLERRQLANPLLQSSLKPISIHFFRPPSRFGFRIVVYFPFAVQRS